MPMTEEITEMRDGKWCASHQNRDRISGTRESGPPDTML